jgi:ParB family transcriptional regulator, chromosome partitioning protein
LAREAATKGWSVRQTEERARAAAGRDDVDVARRVRMVHPEQVEAAERLSEAFGRALGAEVHVTPTANGYRVQFALDSLDQGLEVAERLGVTASS